MLTQLADALGQLADAQFCDPTEIQHGMTTCHMKLGTGTGDFCIRYAAYTKCIDNLLAACPVSVTFTGSMQSATTLYSSQIEKCLYSRYSSGNEKASGSDPQNSGTDNQAHSCSSAELQKKGSSCIQTMTATAAADDVCPAWQTYECCLKDSFTSCGSDMQSKISSMMSTMKTQYNAILPGLAKCAAATCSSSQAGPSPTAAEVETTIMAIIQISDPLAFELDRYVEAVKKATRVAQLPKAVVKAFKILVKYVLPDAILISEAKAAIAKASNVLDSQVQVTQSSARRLGAGRHLEGVWKLNIVDVTITVPDKSKAAAVQTSAADMGPLESAIGGHVSIANAPVTTAKVETKVKSASSDAARLGSQIERDVSDVDGTINAWWLVKDEGTVELSHTSIVPSSTGWEPTKRNKPSDYDWWFRIFACVVSGIFVAGIGWLVLIKCKKMTSVAIACSGPAQTNDIISCNKTLDVNSEFPVAENKLFPEAPSDWEMLSCSTATPSDISSRDGDNFSMTPVCSPCPPSCEGSLPGSMDENCGV